MLFASERQKEVTVRNEKPIFSPTSGERIELRRRVFAKMERGYIPEWANQLVLDTFSMGGKPPSVPPHRWIATYDSALDQQLRKWTDEERALIEKKLLEQGDVIVLTPPVVEAPYALYEAHRKVSGRRTLEHVLKDVQDAYAVAGFDVEQALAFERQNLNDPAVVAALEGLRPVVADAEELIVA